MSLEKLFSAIKEGGIEAVVQIVESDSSLVTKRDREGATALHYAALNGHKEIVEYLLSKGGQINSPDSKFGATPMGWAIEYLREAGGLLTIEIQDLEFAIERNDVELARRFLERFPALKSAINAKGVSLMDLASSKGNSEMVNLFEV